MLLAGVPIDVHAALVAGLKSFGAVSVERVFSVADTLAYATDGRPGDLVLVDWALGQDAVLKLLPQFRSRGWSRVIVTGVEEDDPSAHRFVRAGAHGILVAPRPPDFPRLLRQGAPRSGDFALSTQRAVDAADVRAVLARNDSDARLRAIRKSVSGAEVCGVHGPVALSADDRVVLQFIAEGATTSALSAALGVPESSIKNRIARLGHKLGTGDRTRMVLLALRADAIR